MTSSTLNTTELSDKDVANYLLRHPDFFKDNPGLITELNFPHGANGAVSLLERQVSLMREHQRETRQRMSVLAENARRNEGLLEKIQTLSITLIATSDLGEALHSLRTQVIEQFQLNDCFVVSSSLKTTQNHPQLIPVSNEELRQFESLIYGRDVFLGKTPSKLGESFFNSRRTLNQSIAVVEFHTQYQNHYLVIGSANENHFRSDMATLFIRYIARLCGALFSQY